MPPVRMWRVGILTMMTAAIGCSTSAPEVAPPAGASHDHKVLLRIVGRDRVIVVRSGEAGATWSLESADGEVLVPDMTLDELRAEHPQLHQRVRTMQADPTWAGM